MRRRYNQKSKSPKKEFINSYHVNQVPLPYYNPLSDPYLQGFFTNSKVSRHVQKMGLLYSPEKEYPYQERKLINFNKFHRSNYYDVPPTNLYKNHSSFFRKEKARSLADFSKSGDSTQCDFYKRMSETDLLIKHNDRLSRGDILSQRPLTNFSPRRVAYSSEGKNRSFIFRKKEVPNRDCMHHSGELVF